MGQKQEVEKHNENAADTFGLPKADTTGLKLDSAMAAAIKKFVEDLHKGPKCRTILMEERPVLAETNPNYVKLSESQMDERLHYVLKEFDDFHSVALSSIKERLSEKGVSLPPKTSADLDAIFVEIQTEIWSRFEHAPTTFKMKKKNEIPQRPSRLAGVTQSLFEILDSDFSGKKFLDCKTSLYLCADLMESLGAGRLSIIMLPGHVVLEAQVEEGKADGAGRYYETTAEANAPTPKISMFMMDSKEFEEKYPGFKVHYQWYVDNPALQLALGNMYFEAGKWQEAMDRYMGLLQEVRFDANAHWNVMLCNTKHRLADELTFFAFYLIYEGSNTIADVSRLTDVTVPLEERNTLMEQMFDKLPIKSLAEMMEIWNE